MALGDPYLSQGDGGWPGGVGPALRLPMSRLRGPSLVLRSCQTLTLPGPPVQAQGTTETDSVPQSDSQQKPTVSQNATSVGVPQRRDQ